ncbi:DUF924 family protein [Vogesella oryzae]|uniref:DUF924 family protein n=1 Tax=Vogesella oryzae TaxID=1735285 RepID=UPI0015833BDA|nr:DUF924 family protein [Vogesella oryzae]
MLWHDEVLQFWFGGSSDEMLSIPRDAWFKKDAVYDSIIRERFLELVTALQAGRLAPVLDDARQALAWLIVADQFPRNLFRGEARAFASDALAQQVARDMLAARLDQQLPPVARWFCYLPLEHSEQLADQHECVRRFTALPPDSPGYASVLDYAARHRDIIARFGRFPHRNAALARNSSAEELAFLQQPGSSF